MTRDDIIRQLYTVFHTPALYDIDTDKLHSILDAVAAAERDRCCKIIYGMAGSDNVAQRTVEAIRGEP